MSGSGGPTWGETRPLLRPQLMSRAYLERSSGPRNRWPLFEPWRFGLVEALTVCPGNGTIHFPTAAMLDGWDVALADALAAGRENLLAALAPGAARPPVRRQYGPLALVAYDNDVPGYAATRLLWPGLVAERPSAGERVFILAHDRDYLATVRCPEGEAAAALHLLWQIKVHREGNPRPILPDTPLAMTPSGKLHPVAFRRPDSGLLVPLR